MAVVLLELPAGGDRAPASEVSRRRGDARTPPAVLALLAAALAARVRSARLPADGARRETEPERLRNDAAARERMASVMQAAGAESEAPGAWKWAIRKRLWDHMEANNISAFPRPVHHRIPNFVDAELTAAQVERLPEWQRARWVKVNPDTPQAPIRLAALRAGKTLLVPQPRLRTGFFSVLNPAAIPPNNFAVSQCRRPASGSSGGPLAWRRTSRSTSSSSAPWP